MTPDPDRDPSDAPTTLPACPVERDALVALARQVRGVLRQHLTPPETVRTLRAALTRHMLEFRSAGDGLGFEHGEPDGVFEYLTATRTAGGKVAIDAGRAFEPDTTWVIELTAGDGLPLDVPFALTVLVGVCVEEPADRVAYLVGRELARQSAKHDGPLELWARRYDGLALWLRAEGGAVVSESRSTAG